MTELNLCYQPRKVSPPGDTLAELLGERGITQAELARRMGRPLNPVNEMILGTKEITEETALELERVLGTPANFWLAREAKFREFLARQRDAIRMPDRMMWLDSLPLKQLQKIGVLNPGRLTPAFKATLVEPALRFFGVASPQGWQDQYGKVQAAFRRANPARQTNNAAITAWLRLGGGGFRFMTLGAPVFDEYGRIHPDARFVTLAAFIWQQETGAAWIPPAARPGTPYLGTNYQLDSYSGTPDMPESHISLVKTPKFACYLLFNGILGDKRPASGNVLTREVLDALLTLHAVTSAPAAPLLVYGEACRLGPERLKQGKVTFKHIPYDVKAR